MTLSAAAHVCPTPSHNVHGGHPALRSLDAGCRGMGTLTDASTSQVKNNVLPVVTRQILPAVFNATVTAAIVSLADAAACMQRADETGVGPPKNGRGVNSSPCSRRIPEASPQIVSQEHAFLNAQARRENIRRSVEQAAESDERIHPGGAGAVRTALGPGPDAAAGFRRQAGRWECGVAAATRQAYPEGTRVD